MSLDANLLNMCPNAGRTCAATQYGRRGRPCIFSPSTPAFPARPHCSHPPQVGQRLPLRFCRMSLDANLLNMCPKLVPQCISPMVPIRGTDGEVTAHALRFALCIAGSPHSMALVAIPGLNAVAFNPVAVMSASNVVSARKSENLTLLVETAM